MWSKATRASIGTTRGGRFGLHLDPDPVPECHVALDPAGQRDGMRVVPGWVRVGLPVHDDRVVSGQALPRAHRPGPGGGEVLLVQRPGWEVVVALQPDGAWRLGEHRPVPYRAQHSAASISPPA